MTNFRKAIVHHAEDISAWRNPNVESQMHWVADLFVNNSLPTVEHMLEDIYKRTNNIETVGLTMMVLFAIKLL